MPYSFFWFATTTYIRETLFLASSFFIFILFDFRWPTIFFFFLHTFCVLLTVVEQVFYAVRRRILLLFHSVVDFPKVFIYIFVDFRCPRTILSIFLIISLFLLVWLSLTSVENALCTWFILVLIDHGCLATRMESMKIKTGAKN